jgi:hypothetical protein
MKSIVFYFCLLILLVFGMMLFDYAFPNLSTQQCIAATLAVYCFSFATTSWIQWEMKNNDENKDN